MKLFPEFFWVFLLALIGTANGIFCCHGHTAVAALTFSRYTDFELFTS